MALSILALVCKFSALVLKYTITQLHSSVKFFLLVSRWLTEIGIGFWYGYRISQFNLDGELSAHIC